MSLQDCFKKAGKALNGSDKAEIEQLVSDGVSESEAVNQVISSVDEEINEIAGAVEEQGGEVKRAQVLEQFAGAKSKTADLQNLEQAKRMLSEGVSMSSIRRNTGWHKAADGQWRYEISDDAADLKMTEAPETDNISTLGRVLDHEQLFEAYPDLSIMLVEFKDMGEFGPKGQLDVKLRKITLNTQANKEDMLSTLLHEVQHAIQEKEGFAIGGSPDGNFTGAIRIALGDMNKDLKNRVKNLEEMLSDKITESERQAEVARYSLMYQSMKRLREYANKDKPSGVFRLIRNEMQWIYPGKGDQVANDLQRRFYEIPTRGKQKGQARNKFISEMAWDAAEWLQSQIPADIRKEFDEDPRTIKGMISALEREASKSKKKLKPLDDLRDEQKAAEAVRESSLYKAPYEIYRSLHGEIEARNTQARQKLTDKERSETPLSMTQDVSDSDAIVVFGGMEIQAPLVYRQEGSQYVSDSSEFEGVSEEDAFLADELIDNGAEITRDGKVRLYHRTSKDAAKSIRSTKKMIGKEDGLFFSTSKDGQAEGFGDDIVEVHIPLSELMIDDMFGDEAHVRVEARTGKKVDISDWLSTETLMQGGPGPRGYFSTADNSITLTPRADLSTFLHESGHFFLEIMRDLAPQSPEIQKDLDTLDAWWKEQKIKDPVKQHEAFASGFETYLMEGKAPTRELQSMFSRFRQWLSFVYKKLQSSSPFKSNSLAGVELSDEVRDVMDRLVATQDEIDAAKIENNYGPFSAEDLDLSPAEAAKYQELINEADEEAEVKLTTEAMKELHREKQTWWKRELLETKKLVLSEIAARPEYQARDYLSGDTIPEGMEAYKLDRAYIKEVYGKDASKRMMKMTSKEGAHPDNIAPVFGYSSGEEMILALLGTMTKANRDKHAQAEAEDRMKRVHGDMLTDGSLDQEAQQAVHSEKQADRLLEELKYLNRSAGKRPTPRQYFKAAAERQMASTPIDQVKPHVHRRNEVKARNAALKAAANKDFKTAAIEQHRAVRQFYLYREARLTIEKADKHRNRLRQMQKTKYSTKKVDKNYIQQLKVLLAAFDMRKQPKDSQKLLDRVQAFIEAQAESNPDLVAGDILRSIESWKSMTLEDLESLRSAAENLLKIGKKNSEEANEIWRQQRDEVLQSINENNRDPKPVNDSDSFIATARRGKEQFSAIHRKLESLLQEADGWHDDGILQKLVFRKLWDSQISEMDRVKDEHAELDKIFEGYEYLFNGFKNSLKDIEATKKYVDLHQMKTSGGVRNMTRAERIVLALNWGNEGNREAIRQQKNRGMEDAEVMRALETLTADELQLVNKIWEYVDKFYPELSKIEQDATGIAPPKVEPESFTVNGVEMRGGYYPLQADSSFDWRAEMHVVEERANKLRNEGGAVRSSTKHGATIERVGFGGQAVNLSIDGLFKHVDGIVHDITHRQSISEVDRLLRDEQIRDAISSSIGREGYKAINQAVTRLAAGSHHPSDLAILNKMMRWSRVATSYGAMGYSVRTAIINVTGLLPAIPEVGKQSIASSMLKSMFEFSALKEEVTGKSKMMEHRAQTITRDVYETLRNMKGDKRWNSFKAHAFWMIAQVDGFVSRAVWDAAYTNEIQKGTPEQDAIYAADRAVIRTQGGGLKIDLSAVEDQNEVYRALSPMYTYFNAVLNLSKRQAGKFKTGQMSKREYFEAMAWLFIAVPMLEFLMFGDAEDEPEEQLPKEVASYYLGQWFGVRELSSYIKYGQFFETPLQRTLGAAPAAAYETGSILFTEDEFDKGSLRKYTDLLPVMGFPSGVQINRTLGYLMEIEESGEEDFSPFKLLVTGKEDDTVVESLIFD